MAPTYKLVSDRLPLWMECRSIPNDRVWRITSTSNWLASQDPGLSSARSKSAFNFNDLYIFSALRSICSLFPPIDRSLAPLIRSEWMIDRIQTILHLLQSLHCISLRILPSPSSSCCCCSVLRSLIIWRSHEITRCTGFAQKLACGCFSISTFQSAEELPPGNTYWTIIEFPPIISRLLWLLVILSRRRGYSSSSSPLKLTLINIFHLSSIRRSYNCDLQRETRYEVKHWTGYGDNKHVTYLIAPLSSSSTSSPGVSVHNKNHSKWLSFADSSSSSSPSLIRPAITLQIEQIKCKRLKE